MDGEVGAEVGAGGRTEAQVDVGSGAGEKREPAGEAAAGHRKGRQTNREGEQVRDEQFLMFSNFVGMST